MKESFEESVVTSGEGAWESEFMKKQF
jgi:hypothetical protein